MEMMTWSFKKIFYDRFDCCLHFQYILILNNNHSSLSDHFLITFRTIASQCAFFNVLFFGSSWYLWITWFCWPQGLFSLQLSFVFSPWFSLQPLYARSTIKNRAHAFQPMWLDAPPLLWLLVVWARYCVYMASSDSNRCLAYLSILPFIFSFWLHIFCTSKQSR